LARPSQLARTGSKALDAYTNLGEDIRSQICSGDLSPHDELPLERELSLTYGISSELVKQALDLLEGQGLIYTNRGAGIFVAAPKIEIGIEDKRRSTTTGQPLRMEILTAEKRPALLAQAGMFGIDPGTPILEVRRVVHHKDEALGVETTFWPSTRWPRACSRELDSALWADLLEELAVHSAWTTRSLEAVVLDPDTSEPLGARPCTPGLALRRLTFDTSNRCIAYSHETYRADRVSLVMDEKATPNDTLFCARSG
jgi:GntR family transcriptional regulator